MVWVDVDCYGGFCCYGWCCLVDFGGLGSSCGLEVGCFGVLLVWVAVVSGIRFRILVSVVWLEV